MLSIANPRRMAEEQEEEPVSEVYLPTRIGVAVSAVNGEPHLQTVEVQTAPAAGSTAVAQRKASTRSQHSQISPPLTPRASREALRVEIETSTFHNYLRAYYHFHPSSTVDSSTDESSITVPINQGDVILVHSIHPNGWADGTILSSGDRGWLPTNYCEPYHHDAIQTLLDALTQLWDLVRTGEQQVMTILLERDYVKGMIAGVRCFLEHTDSLSRDSPPIVNHIGLRKVRKTLLVDLSGLVRISKELRIVCEETPKSLKIFELLDSLVLKACRVVVRAVRFLDIWNEHYGSRRYSIPDSDQRPLTPPVDAQEPANQDGELVPEQTPVTSDSDVPVSPSESYASTAPLDAIHALAPAAVVAQPTHVARPVSLPAKRISISHRLSYASGSAQRKNLASERLALALDSFLSLLGTFIGLHYSERPHDDLKSATDQSVTACRLLLDIVEEVWARDGRRSDALADARDVMYAKLAELVQATKDMFDQTEMSENVVGSRKELIMTTTSCIRAAGECVSKAQTAIGRIGDFEFEHVGLGLAESVFDTLAQTPQPSSDEDPAKPERHSLFCDKPLPAPPSEPLNSPTETPPEPTVRPPPPPPLLLPDSKPLPDTPKASPMEPQPSLKVTIVDSPKAASTRSSRSSIHQLPAPHFPAPESVSATYTPISEQSADFELREVRIDSFNTGVVSDDSWRNSLPTRNGSVVSLASASTRATTPESSPQQSTPMIASIGSSAELQSLHSETSAEQHVLIQTYAHELVYNKAGHVIGGSLPALVERLTTHESTPKGDFVATFYLTFRLFTTPSEFASCLVERYEYAGESPLVGVPIRLRVYNQFKGWLESHWQCESDSAALPIIQDFAAQLQLTPMAGVGRRLAELATKVSDLRTGALVPRLISALGHTSTSVSLFNSTEKEIPVPIVTKSQLSALRAARNGGHPCSIVDFDPLEIARQFTIIESRIFCSIAPEELLDLEWQKKIDSRAVNVRAMSKLSNDLASLVTDSILNLEEPKKRALVIKQWIKISMKCLDLHNYDSLMAIVCALQSSMVVRLRKTWDLVSAKTKGRFDELTAIVDCSRNHAALRRRLEGHVPPCIPFVGIYLTDLTFVDAGNQKMRELPVSANDPDTPPRMVVNFDKYMRVAKIIDQLQRFQVPYKLAAVPEMQDWMDSQIQRVRSNDASIQSFYRRSCILEPREQVQAQPQTGGPEGHQSKESLGGMSTKERFEFWGTLQQLGKSTLN
ncbi:ras GEF [Trichodelitschia bisporula]|uniref:Ras GEF n=1 Tax=Trichodelitschia bisporula TaxID=703511 RepID=A0A6G1HTB3_9PEZI|nr:ras GEF [Trichodelitschia bisporula]